MINLNSKGLIVQYIQNFLKDNYDNNIHLSDKYDKETHKALINYLLKPEVLTAHSMKNLLIETFTYREVDPPNRLIDEGGLWNFNFDITIDTVRFFNRPTNQCLNGASTFVIKHIDEVSDLCRNNGWYVDSYTNFNRYNTDESEFQVEIIIKKENRKQLLPSKDIINMINFSTNDYLLNKCFLDNNNSYHGFIQYSENFKIALIPAKPGDTFTIAHGYSYACELAIAYTDLSLKELKQEGHNVLDIRSRLSSSILGELDAGDYEIYSIPKDTECTYLLIQMPFTNSLLNKTKKTSILLGDINRDGKITYNVDDENSDYSLLKKYVTAKKNNQILPFHLTGEALLAANLNGDVDENGNPIIDEIDLMLFEEKIKSGNKVDFGYTTYEKEIELTELNFDKLLVIYGNIENGNKDNELNIPISEYQQNPWLIHDEFLPYILGSAIHRYSDMEDIEWLQKIASSINPNYLGLTLGHYDCPEDFILNASLKWNNKKNQYEYHKDGIFTGWILDNSTDPTNGKLIKELDLSPTSTEIISGKWIVNGQWTGSIVLSDGRITKELSKNTLKEIIKEYQIFCNSYYKNQSSELIKFINGYVTPLTEKWLPK